MRRYALMLRRGFGENVRFAFNAIREHKLRSGLTILGIVVGVTTVIAMVAIVTGFNNNVIGNLQTFGASRVEIEKYEQRFGPGGPLGDEERRRKNLTMEHVYALREGVPEAIGVTGLGVYFDADVHVKNGNLEANSPYIVGTDEQYPMAVAHSVAHGRFLTKDEVEHNVLVAVIGADVKDAIFGEHDPVGKEITINALRYRVVGVLERKGEQFGYSPDNKVVMPHGAFHRQFSLQDMRDGIKISLVPRRPEEIDAMIEKATAVLRAKRRVPMDKPNDFAVITPDQLVGQFRALTGGVTIAMIAIALVSLVVGGVGVMNIMLVSVTQRTREIGVRKAVGAFRRDIVWQFLTEAVTLSSFGGVIGVLLGFGIAELVRVLPISLPAAVPFWSVLVGLAVSTSVGIFFGLYPAVKASRLDPIEALRYE